MAPELPVAKLKSGYDMPFLGLGTWKAEPGVVQQAVETALELGCRHIDCAFIYGNEKEIGRALKRQFAEGKIAREDVFITSKLWNTYHSPHLVLPSLQESLDSLGLDYLDLYLIHWPVGYQEGGELFPRTCSGTTATSDVDYVATWRQLEQAVRQGSVRSLGVSNFNQQQLQRIIDVSSVPLCVNQVECHPYLNQKQLMQFCRQHDILITAYSPLGSPARPWAQPGDPQLLLDQRVKVIADRQGKSVAQILIGYQLQRGNAVIPKSTTADRIGSNMQVTDFTLTSQDLAELDSMHDGTRFCPLAGMEQHQHYPF